MRVPGSRPRTDFSDTPMTSMIDVVFLLLIFFLCAAASRQAEKILPADLQAGQVIAPQPVSPRERIDEVWIRLIHAPPGRLLLELNGTTYDQLADLRAILQALAELEPRSPVILDIAPEVPAGDVVAVWDICRGVGLEAIHFSLPRE